MADRNYADLVGKKGKVLTPTQAMPDTILEPSLERQRAFARDYLNSRQYAPEAVEDVMGGPSTDSYGDRDYARIFDATPATPTHIRAAAEESWKIDKQEQDSGVQMAPSEREGIQKFLEPIKNRTLVPLAESRRWWNQTLEWAGDKMADNVSAVAADFNLGLASLDGVVRFVNAGVPNDWVRDKALDTPTNLPSVFLFPPSFVLAGRLSLLPKDQVEDVKARVLPKYPLRTIGGDVKEFGSGFTASMWLLGQKMIGSIERDVGSALQHPEAALVLGLPGVAIPGAIRASGAGEFGKKLEMRGEKRQRTLRAGIGQLTAAIPKPLMIDEVVERNWSPVADMDQFYNDMLNMPPLFPGGGISGNQVLAGMAGGIAMGEIWVDNLLVAGALPGMMTSAGRAATLKFAPQKAADITSSIARKTMRFDDAVRASKVTETIVETKNAKVAKEAEELGHVTKQSYDELIAANRQHTANRQLVNTFEDPGMSDPILLRSAPRRNPDQIPEPPLKASDIDKEMHKYRKQVAEIGADLDNRWLQVMDDAHAALTRKEAQLGLDLQTDVQAQIRSAKDLRTKLVDLNEEATKVYKESLNSSTAHDRKLAQMQTGIFDEARFAELQQETFKTSRDFAGHHLLNGLNKIFGTNYGTSEATSKVLRVESLPEELQRLFIRNAVETNSVDSWLLEVWGKDWRKNVPPNIRKLFTDEIAGLNDRFQSDISVPKFLPFIRQENKLPTFILPAVKGIKNLRLPAELEIDPKLTVEKIDLTAQEPVTSLIDKLDTVISRLERDIPNKLKSAMRQRIVLGPDDAEIAGDGLNMMMRGGTIDDVTLSPIAPEYRAMPDISPPLLGESLRKSPEVLKAEKDFVNSMQGRQYDLFNSTEHMLLRQEDIIRRNLGIARQTKNKPDIALFDKELNQVRKGIDRLRKSTTEDADVMEARTFSDLQRKLEVAKLADDSNEVKILQKQMAKFADKAETPKAVDDLLKYEDSWLPKSEPSMMEDPTKLNRWLHTATDRVMRSLYPGGLTVNMWNTRVGRLFGQFRDPQRYYEAYSPEMWNTIRGSYAKYATMQASWNNQIRRGMLDAGILQKHKKFDPKVHFAPYKVDAKKSEQLFDLLDTVEDTPAWRELAAEASPEMIKVYRNVRKTLDDAANAQGISGVAAAEGGALVGYMHHYFDRSQLAGGARPLEYIGMPATAETFVSHLVARRGNANFSKDAVGILDFYGRSMYRKMILEPMYQDILRDGKKMSAEMGSNMHVNFANDFVNHLKGKPAFAGQIMDEWVGGAVNTAGKTMWQPDKIDRTLAGISSMFYAGTLVGNPRYPLMQMATGIATTAGRFGMMRTLRGVMQMATKEGQLQAKQAGVYEPFKAIFDTKAGRIAGELMTKVPTVSPLGVMTNGQAEFMVRGITFHAAMDEHLTRQGFSTLSQAMQAGFGKRIMYDALRSSEEVNHQFGQLGRNPKLAQKFGRGAIGSATQFLSFGWKQTDELLSQANRDPVYMGYIARYLGVSGWMARVAAQEFGIDLTNYVGLGYLPQDPDELTSPGVDFLLNWSQLSGSMAVGDLEGTKRHAKMAGQSMATMVVPGMAAYITASRSADRMVTGQSSRLSGGKIRDLDFSKGLLPGVGSDLAPTVFGQQNINDKLYDLTVRSIRQQNKQAHFNLSRTVDDFVDAVQAGDVTKQEELSQVLGDVYQVRFSGTTSIMREYEARHLSELLRLYGENPKTRDLFMETLKNNGLGLEP